MTGRLVKGWVWVGVLVGCTSGSNDAAGKVQGPGLPVNGATIASAFDAGRPGAASGPQGMDATTAPSTTGGTGATPGPPPFSGPPPSSGLDAGEHEVITCGAKQCTAPTWEDLSWYDPFLGKLPLPTDGPEPRPCCAGEECGITLSGEQDAGESCVAQPWYDSRCGYMAGGAIYLGGCCDEMNRCGLNYEQFGLGCEIIISNPFSDAAVPERDCGPADSGTLIPWPPTNRPASECPMPCPECPGFDAGPLPLPEASTPPPPPPYPFPPDFFPTPPPLLAREPCCRFDDTCGCTDLLRMYCL